MRRLLTLLTLTVTVSAFAQGPYRSSITYESYEGLVMAGYQGWFNTPGDGAGRNWHHYEKGRRFEPGWCTIDLWPEVDEYPQLYETAFRFEDGSPAFVPSPYDKSTVDVHFRWMREYGLDGVFLQRFIAEIANPSGKKHFDRVMDSAMECANKYDRAVAIMYDLSGMPANGPDILLKDIDALAETHHLFDRQANPSYLYQNGKPLVTVWGVGFNDNRKYGFDECEKIIDGLKAKGFSVMIGVPTHWRTLTKDTLPDKRLHELIRKCDIVMPWFVGRYNEWTYDNYKTLIRKDMAWAEEEAISYAPLCFPGFSWANMHRVGRPGVQIPRNGGSFFKKQLDYCLDSGAKMLYIAMFDEIDEGTAIFKIARKVPVAAPGSTFVPLEDGVPSDRYLTLAGEAAARLKGKRTFVSASAVRPASYAGNTPRFKALLYYSDAVEEAHQQFAQQGIEFFHKLTYGEGWILDVSKTLEGDLSGYDVIIMPNVAPSSPRERKLFEEYMKNGGGWLGFHGAGYNDRSTGWDWFRDFLGGVRFLCNTWPPQPGLVDIETHDHDVTRNLPDAYVAPATEFYQWQPDPRSNPSVKVLASLSTKNFPMGLKDVVFGGDFPVVWTNTDYRMVYINMGHGDECFSDATQNLLFVNALRWVVSCSPKGNPFER